MYTKYANKEIHTLKQTRKDKLTDNSTSQCTCNITLFLSWQEKQWGRHHFNARVWGKFRQWLNITDKYKHVTLDCQQVGITRDWIRCVYLTSH